MRTRALVGRISLLALAVALGVCVITTSVMASTTGIISGVVSDAAKGTKLSGVNVVVKGLNLTTVTDAKGFFVITNVPPGTYEVTADIVGFQEASGTDVQVMMDTTATVDFALREAVTQEKEAAVIVARSLVHPDTVPTLYVVTDKQEQLTRSNQPGSLYQVPGIVLTLPGVTADPQGYPHIRGGRSQQVGYMLEGIPITEPTSNGFGTNLVTVGMSKMQVHTGGYRAEYGNAISGVFNEIKKTGRELGGGGNIESLLGSQAYKGVKAEFGEVTGSGLDYYVSTYLWHTQYERNFAQEGDIADNIGKFVYSVGKDDKLTLLLNQGSGKMFTAQTHTESLSGPVPEARDSGQQRYEIAGLTWSHNFSPASFLTIRPYVYNSLAKFDGLSFPWAGGYGFFNTSSAAQRGLQMEYTSQLTNSHLLKTGVSAIASRNAYLGYTPYLTLDMFGSLSTDPYYYESNTRTLQTAFFAQDQIKVGNKCQVELGARLEAMKYNKSSAEDLRQSAFEPRFGLTYSPTSRNVWRLSLGKYAMFTPSSLMGREYNNAEWGTLYKAGDSRPNPERSTSIDLGFERQVSDNAVMRVTPFYRWYQDLLQASDVLVGGVPTGATEYTAVGEGKAAGCEFHLGKKMSNNWEGWLSYTWMRATANASSYTTYDPNVMTYVDWDQRNTLAAAFAHSNGRLTHTMQLQYGSGLPYTLGADPVANVRRMDSNFLVNYGLTFKLPKNSILGKAVHLDIYNLFNTGTQLHRDYSDAPDAWLAPRFINLSITKDL
ncbi:MAG: TonB-dependent receptor [Armatimonadota bacterium]|nr:TonB-dependent receptor [Armatimonadota bacterium]